MAEAATPKRKRRKYGTGADRVQLLFRVSPDAKHKVDQIANAFRMSQSELFEKLLTEVEFDESGAVYLGDRFVEIDPQEEFAFEAADLQRASTEVGRLANTA